MHGKPKNQAVISSFPGAGRHEPRMQLIGYMGGVRKLCLQQRIRTAMGVIQGCKEAFTAPSSGWNAVMRCLASQTRIKAEREGMRNDAEGFLLSESKGSCRGWPPELRKLTARGLHL